MSYPELRRRISKANPSGKLVIAITLLVGIFTFGNIWLILCFALLLRPSFHRPTNLFGGLRRFATQVFSTVELQPTVTIWEAFGCYGML